MPLSQTQDKAGTTSKVDSNPTNRTGRSNGQDGGQKGSGISDATDAPQRRKGGSEPRQTQGRTGITGRADSDPSVSPERLPDGVDRPFPSP